MRATRLADLFAVEAWMAHGACARAGENPDDWFPPHAKQKNAAPAAHALEVCGACPVVDQCLIYAIQYPSIPGLTGIWGMTTESERKPAANAYRVAHPALFHRMVFK